MSRHLPLPFRRRETKKVGISRKSLNKRTKKVRKFDPQYDICFNFLSFNASVITFHMEVMSVLLKA